MKFKLDWFLIGMGVAVALAWQCGWCRATRFAYKH